MGKLLVDAAEASVDIVCGTVEHLLVGALDIGQEWMDIALVDETPVENLALVARSRMEWLEILVVPVVSTELVRKASNRNQVVLSEADTHFPIVH